MNWHHCNSEAALSISNSTIRKMIKKKEKKKESEIWSPTDARERLGSGAVANRRRHLTQVAADFMNGIEDIAPIATGKCAADPRSWRV